MVITPPAKFPVTPAGNPVTVPPVEPPAEGRDQIVHHHAKIAGPAEESPLAEPRLRTDLSGRGNPTTGARQ